MSSSDTNNGRLFFQSETFETTKLERRKPSGRVVEEPAQTVPVHTECDVLVVGGGPSGTAAACRRGAPGRRRRVARALQSSRRAVDRRPRHLDRPDDRLERQARDPWFRRRNHARRFTRDTIAGPSPRGLGLEGSATRSRIGRQRTAAYHGIVTYSPTLDPEWLKAESLAMVLEAGVHPIFHAWAASADGRGAARDRLHVREQGRPPRGARQGDVDATGDGDIYARAGAAFETEVDAGDIHGCMNTAWLFGGVDMNALLRFRSETPEQFAAIHGARPRARCASSKRRVVSWRNDVARVHGAAPCRLFGARCRGHVRGRDPSHQLMLEHLDVLPRQRAGLCRRLHHAVGAATRRAPRAAARRRRHGDARAMGRPASLADEIGVSPSLSPKFRNDLGALRRPGAARSSRPAGARPAYVVRHQQPFVHARNSAMLADRSGRRHRRRDRRGSRPAAGRSADRRLKAPFDGARRVSQPAARNGGKLNCVSPQMV